MPVRCGRHRDPRRAARVHRLRLARLPARRRAGPALRIPLGRRPSRARRPPPSLEAAARPVRPCDRRVDPLARRGRCGQRRGLGALRAPLVGREPVVRLGLRPSSRDPLERDGALRGPCEGHDGAAPRRAGPAPGDLPGHVRTRGHRPPVPARGHGGRADADPPVRPRPAPGRARAAQLLGLQLDRVLRTAQRVRGRRPGRRPGPRVQGDGQDPARGGHRGDPRRGLQPHRRGGCGRARAELQGPRQPRLLPARSRRTRRATSTTPGPATASTCATRTCCS